MTVGSRRSIVFNDIDGNILSVKALFYVNQISDRETEPVLVLDQAQFAEHPDPDYWIDKVAAKSGVAAADLTFNFSHFRGPEIIEQDILRAMYRGTLTKNDLH